MLTISIIPSHCVCTHGHQKAKRKRKERGETKRKRDRRNEKNKAKQNKKERGEAMQHNLSEMLSESQRPLSQSYFFTSCSALDIAK